MDQLLENIVIGVSTGLVAGLITGLYSGLVISRVMRFNNLRSEALRAFNSIWFIENDDGSVKVEVKDLSSTMLAASDMYYFGHAAAGNKLMLQLKQVGLAVMQVEGGRVTIGTFQETLATAQKATRSLSPTMKVLVPFGKI